jgi:hypothetical protein
MPDESSKSKAKDEPSKSKAEDEPTQRAREVAETPEDAQSDAEAPGPITPEHESGSWEQTLAEREAQEKTRDEASKKSS